MRFVVVGAGAWGTAFSRLLADRGHDVTLAARDAEQARAIEETGRNPRYLPTADLSAVTGAAPGRPRTTSPKAWLGTATTCRSAPAIVGSSSVVPETPERSAFGR